MTGPFSHELITEFERRFGGPPQVAAQAPGRVNLIGEHTDYSGGLVLPCAIDRVTRVLAARRPRASGPGLGPGIRVWASDLGQIAEFDPGRLQAEGGWVDYVKGVVFSLAEQGHAVDAVDLVITSELPREAGLSSSAALGVAVITALDQAFGLELGAAARARLVHRSENHFVGTGCGILDQFASALGRRDHALRIDCRSQEVDAIAMPVGRVTLLVAHSGVTRRLARGDYRERVAECQQATQALRKAEILAPDSSTLRDLAVADLSGLEEVLGATLFRRVRHVVTENQRVDGVCRDLVAEDLRAVGEALREGQRSLREDFEVSTPELDALCEIADALPGVHGSRLTGAGFGGCSVHLVDSESAHEVATELRRGFEERVGYGTPVWIVRPADGASVIDEF
jgi:galactokinase